MISLDERSIPADPHALFDDWFQAAKREPTADPTAMTLATVNAEGRPSARIVLLKAVDARGFVFYTNYQSRKANDLDARPFAALTFWWPWLKRQVRIEGAVERIADQESDAYFASRPRLSQIGAWASDQSRPVADRPSLEQRVQDTEAQFADKPVPRPPHWGGYRVLPERIEFWQDQSGRLHDRFLYHRTDADWTRERLYP